MRSPKLGGSARGQYYRYYAGYTEGFVEDMLRRLDVPTNGLLVDPWNGAGTTTAAAAAQQIEAIGYDINPAAVLIGRARLLRSDVAGSLVPIAVEICARARECKSEPRHDDLLCTWFGPGTALELRTLERCAYQLLVDPTPRPTSAVFDSNLPHSALAAVFYVALFRTVRGLLSKYVPSNPSWIKNPSGRRLGIPRSELHASFVQHVKLSDPYLGQLALPTVSETGTKIEIASSTDLPLDDESVDAIASSPPYCTRLDYVKATLPELAVMGLTSDQVRALRNAMIGTPTMSGTSALASPEMWGTKTPALINTITEHRSKASATYYKKYYLQYFSGMWASLNELLRVVKPNGNAVLVVQDSYYKDVHIDLPALIGDMSVAAGWSNWDRLDFPVPRTMAAINPRTRQYRQEFRATESAVVLRR